MMQVDTAATRIPRFVDKAARAGCVQVFIGMESLRDDNLKAVDKRQNRVDFYRDSIACWHEAGVLCHVGFIIGFPYDTYDRIMEDVRTLREDLLVDQASFFMLTPLPGSRDHRAAVEAGTPMDPDYNNFDSFRAAAPHPRMSAEEWTAAYRDAWKKFYAFDHMKTALLRQNPHTYWGMFKVFMWYRASMVEGTHPMVTGFFRLKDRLSRRPSFPIEGRWQFFKRRVRESAHITLAYARLWLEMQELWLATRIRRDEYAFIGDLRGLRARAAAMLEVKANWSRIHAAMAARLQGLRTSAGESAPRFNAAMQARFEAIRQSMGSRADELARAAETTLQGLRLPSLPPLRPRSALRRFTGRLNVFGAPSLETRRALSAYWAETETRVRRFQLWRLNPFRLVWNGARDLKNTIVFMATMATERVLSVATRGASPRT